MMGFCLQNDDFRLKDEYFLLIFIEIILKNDGFLKNDRFLKNDGFLLEG